MSGDFLSLDNLLRPVQEENAQSGKIQKTSTDSAKTLESFHNQQMNKFRDEKSNLTHFEQELANKKRQFAAIEHEYMNPTRINTSGDLSLLTNRSKLEQEIRELEQKIGKLKSGETESDYFLRVGEILFSYSDAQERIATGERPINDKQARMPANSVYSYFFSEEQGTASEPPLSPTKEEAPSRQKRANDISNDIGFKRDKALESYLCALNPDTLQNENAVASSITANYGNCAICSAEMFLNETYLDCPECGYRDIILVDSEKPSYKDPPREMSYYAYKKINHLNEWLAQFQAKETTEIAPAVLEQIRTELRKERITDMSKLKPSKLKEVIKKLKLNRCYDHVAHILNRLNGISAPVLSREVEEKLRFMFKEIQFSFVKHCPKKRSNFLSYSFVLYKFCELLELDEYLPCFPLLKSREKLYMQDKIWKKICEDMNWEFIQTV
jgi:hypothetical protein